MSSEATQAAVLDVEAIQRLLPHRPPFLLVDRVVALEPGVRELDLAAEDIEHIEDSRRCRFAGPSNLRHTFRESPTCRSPFPW